MKVEGKTMINASRERVWAFLTDPNSVAACAPGVESMEIIEADKKFRAVASVGLGNLKVKFNADVEWVELDAPNKARMKAHATAPGSAVDVTAEMLLIEKESDSTEMAWSAEIHVLGTIAALAARMMSSVTQKLTGEFFDCMKKQIEG
ncbi:MAG: carbon monoxide dehydrogenase [Chloroflexi bacterium]|nr:carbon monoxide dehydrogenase subunit G [Chloroflexota bacterium]MQC27330.1 carbon monoxide dehydrogenase [Chloroflexota bacterium]